jgi:hypothetical protein
MPTAKGGQHFTQVYFLAYRGFGDEGKEKRWLHKEIDHTGNGLHVGQDLRLLFYMIETCLFCLFLRD